MQKKKTRNWAARIDYSWAWNILGLSCALGVLIAIIIILCVYDGKEQPEHGKEESHFIPRQCRLVAAQVVWFAERKRPLSDLRGFDSASRGLYGSAELLWTLRMR